MDKSNQYDYIKAYNAENYKTFSIKISPEEWAEIDEISKKMNISKARLTVNAIRLYAETVAQNNAGNITKTHSSLTAAETPNPGTPTPETPSPAPEEINPQTVSGAETQHTETETPGEDRQDKPQSISTTTPTSPEIISPEQVAHIAQEAAHKAAQEAYKAGYIKARQEIRAEIKAQQAAARIRATAKRIKAAKARPDKIGKG